MEYNFQGRSNILIEPVVPDGSMIFCFHGGGGSPSEIQDVIDLESQFPSSYISYVASLDGFWRSNTQDVDVAYFHSLLSELKNQYIINSVHLMGHSNGGMMCYKIGAMLDEVAIDSITAIASTYQNPHEFDFAGSVLHIHGVSDTIIPINGNTNYNNISTTINSIAPANPVFRFIEAGHELSEMVLSYNDFYNDLQSNMRL